MGGRIIGGNRPHHHHRTVIAGARGNSRQNMKNSGNIGFFVNSPLGGEIRNEIKWLQYRVNGAPTGEVAKLMCLSRKSIVVKSQN